MPSGGMERPRKAGMHPTPVCRAVRGQHHRQAGERRIPNPSAQHRDGCMCGHASDGKHSRAPARSRIRHGARSGVHRIQPGGLGSRCAPCCESAREAQDACGYQGITEHIDAVRRSEAAHASKLLIEFIALTGVRTNEHGTRNGQKSILTRPCRQSPNIAFRLEPMLCVLREARELGDGGLVFPSRRGKPLGAVRVCGSVAPHPGSSRSSRSVQLGPEATLTPSRPKDGEAVLRQCCAILRPHRTRRIRHACR